MRAASAAIVLLSVAPVSATSPFYDPQYCYFLDGLLMLYGIAITAFFVRERFLKKRGKADEESPYQAINPGGKEVYSEPKRSAEGGRRRGDDTYTPLNRKTDDTYREIEPRGDVSRRRDQVYQGLSSVTKDTYDSLHMQQIHPPPR